MSVAHSTLLDHSRFWTWTKARLRTVADNEVRYLDEPVALAHEATFRRNLRSLAAVARAHGIQVVLGQQAMVADQELFEKHFRSKSYNHQIAYPRIDELCRHFEHYNAVVQEVADEQGLPCVDVHRRLKDHPEHFVDVVHTHASGSRLVAQEFAQALWSDERFQELVAAKSREAGSEQRLAIGSPN
jgi:hypothetical protein